MTDVKDRLDLWTGEFGDEYHRRNEVTERSIEARADWLVDVLESIDDEDRPLPESFLEIGCGRGANLAALAAIAGEGGFDWNLYGIEPNLKARVLAAEYAPVAAPLPVDEIYKWPSHFDLVFTCGLLIHIPPAGLPEMLDQILGASKRYILMAEYFAPGEEEVPYRGQHGALWRRDYGNLLMERGNVKHIAHGFLWKPIDGLDNLVWWLFEKK